MGFRDAEYQHQLSRLRAKQAGSPVLDDRERYTLTDRAFEQQ